MSGLFSFKGEIGRSRMWLIYIAVNVVGLAIGIGCFAASRSMAEPGFNFEGPSTWPQTLAGWGLATLYWVANLLLLWIFAAAFVKRLRDVGIAPKWPGILLAVFVLTIPIAKLLTGAAAQIPDWKFWIVLVVMSPACLMGLWLFGSAFLAPGHKSWRIDPADLPQGWKA